MVQKGKFEYKSDAEAEYEGDIMGLVRSLNHPLTGIIITLLNFYFFITKGYGDPFYWALFFLSLIGLALVFIYNKFPEIEKRIESNKKLNIISTIVGGICLFAMVYLLIIFLFMAFGDALNLFCKYVLNQIKPCEFLIG